MNFTYKKKGSENKVFIVISRRNGYYAYKRRMSTSVGDKKLAGDSIWFKDKIEDALKIYDFSDLDFDKDDYTQSDVDNLYKKARKYRFILDEWNKDNPNNQLSRTEDIIQLSSRFKKFSRWYESTQEKFSAINSSPKWLLEFDPDRASIWDARVKEYLETMNNADRERTQEIQKLARARKKKIQEIDEQFKAKVIQIVRECPEVGIEMLTVDSLPISDQIAAYEIEGSEEQKIFIKEKLFQFKKDKYRKLQEGVLSSEDIIELLLEKL